MKRLLNLLTVITLVGSTSATAIACGSSSAVIPPPAPPKPKPAPIVKETAQDIADKIKNTRIILSAYTDPNLASAETITTLKNALYSLNKTLTNYDLDHITFSLVQANKPLINNGTKAFSRVDANINLDIGDEATNATVVLDVAINIKAEQILSKVGVTKLTLPYVSNSQVQDPATTKLLLTYLQQANINLTNQDLSYLSFEKATLNNDGSETPAAVDLIASVDSHEAKTALMITVEASVNQITSKINAELSYSVASLTDNLSDYASRDDMRTVLQELNPSLTQEDLQLITFENKKLTLNEPTEVQTTIEDTSGHQDQLLLNITRVTKAEADVKDIQAKIKKTTLALSPALPTSSADPATVTALKSTLQALNPTLTADDLSNISFNTVTLEINKEVNVTLTISIKEYSVSLVLKVQLDSKSIIAANKITNTQIYLDANTNPNPANPQTTTQLRNKLQVANPTLTNAEKAMISFRLADPSAPIITDGSETNTSVEAVITNTAIAGDTSTKTLSVAMRPSVDQIMNKITDRNIDVPFTTPERSGPGANKNIVDSLALANNLKAWDKSQLYFGPYGYTLFEDSPTTVVMYVRGYRKEGNDFRIRVTRVNKAKTIKDKITSTSMILEATVNPSTANSATQQAMTAQLKTDNPTLTAEDTTFFNYSSVMLDNSGSETPTNVTLSIIKEGATERVNLSVAIKSSPDQIIAKITNPNLEIPELNKPTSGDAATIQAIKDNLRHNNPTLTLADLGMITFNVVNLPLNTAATVVATVTKGGTSKTINLQVTRKNMAQYIIDKINTSHKIDIQAHANIDPANGGTVAFIKQGLASGSGLTNDELANVTISKATAGTAGNLDNTGTYVYKSVTVTATVAGDSASTQVSVAIKPTAEQFRKAMKLYNKVYKFPFTELTSAVWPQVRQYMYNKVHAIAANSHLRLSDFDMVTLDSPAELFTDRVSGVLITITDGSGQSANSSFWAEYGTP